MPGTTAKYILDSSFFLSGFQLPDGELYTVPQVVDEVRPGRKELGFASALGLSIRSPDEKFILTVQETAEKSGDISRMSLVDLSLVALAFELNGTLLTDDYSMQNTAQLLGVHFKPLGQKGITRVETWYFRCRYCGKYQNKKYPDCPICGGPMKTTRRPPNSMKMNNEKNSNTKKDRG